MLILLVESGRQSNLDFLLTPNRSVTSSWFLLTLLFLMLGSKRTLLSVRITGPCPSLVRLRSVGISVKALEIAPLVFLASGIPQMNLLHALTTWQILLENLTTKIASWSSVACEHALLLAAHGVSEKLQELLNLHWNATDVVERRLINKTIWRICVERRGARRLWRWLPELLNKGVLQVLFSLAVPITSTGPMFSVLRLLLLTRVVGDFFAEIYELKGEELAAEDAARAAHVKDWLDLDPVEKRAGKLFMLDKTIKKLKRGKGCPDGCVAGENHALPSSAREV